MSATGNGRSTESERGRRAALIGLLGAIAVAAALTAVMATQSVALAGFDESVVSFTRGWADRLEWPVALSHEIANKTGVIWSSFIAGLFALFLLVRRRWAAGGFLLASAFLGGLIGLTFKELVGRQRPPGAERYEADLTDSFPSGHTMVGIYLYLATGLVVLRIGQANRRRWMVILGWALIVFGPLLGLTRIIVGAHWPTDVIAGWAFGSAVVLACALALWEPLGRDWISRRTRATEHGSVTD